jgi:hypothetical protein
MVDRGVHFGHIGEGRQRIGSEAIQIVEVGREGFGTMEVVPGVFMSKIEAEEWEFDPEVNGEIHVLCSGVGVEAGMSRFLEVSGPVSYTPPARETLVVLEGSATVRIADGPALEISVGDLVSLPPGVETVWNVTPPFKEFWVLAGTGE